MSDTAKTAHEHEPVDAEIVEALGAIVGPAHVLATAGDRLAYARDCWPRTTFHAREGVFRDAPICVVQPGDEAEVVQLVQWAERSQVALIPYGAGSGVCGGVLPLRTSVTVDMKRIRHIELDAARGFARVGPGAIGQHVETALLRRGYTLGHYPSSLYCSTVGGYLAGRSAGQYSSRYGKIEDMVESMRVVCGGGELVDTAHTGHRLDMLSLLVGSEGTLGMITDALLRVHPAPETRWYRGFMMPSVEAGAEAMRVMMQAGLRPAVLRLYDELDTIMAGKNKHPHSDQPQAEPGVAKRLLARARARLSDAFDASAVADVVDRASKALMGRVLGQPVILSRAIDLLPAGCLLIVGFEGTEQEVDAESQVAMQLVSQLGKDLGPEPGEHWYAHRFSVSYKMSPVMDSGAFTDTMEVSTRWSQIMELYRAVRATMSPHVLVMAHFSHAYRDGCSIYFTFAGFEPTLEGLSALYDRTWEAGMAAVAGCGASIAHHHGVGLSKAPYTPHDHPGGAALFATLKRTLDPAGVLNPGKVWPSQEAHPHVCPHVCPHV